DLQKTIADLKTTRGDLGVQSGLIATNSSELAALKRLGERNYIEFKLGKTKDRQRVGDITLLLKKTDPKKNKYTVEVMADDKLTEKRDKNVNEPVQCYTSKARQPRLHSRPPHPRRPSAPVGKCGFPIPRGPPGAPAPRRKPPRQRFDVSIRQRRPRRGHGKPPPGEPLRQELSRH